MTSFLTKSGAMMMLVIVLFFSGSSLAVYGQGTPTDGAGGTGATPTDGTGGTGATPSDGSTLQNPLKFNSIQEFLLAIVDILLILLLPIIVLAIIYSGFLFVSAQGNEDQLTRAKKAFTWAVVGGLLILGARVLVDVIQNTIKSIT